MLTKELLNTKFVGEQVLPCFLSLADARMLQIAERMVAAYQSGIGLTRAEIDELLAPLILECNSQRIGNGLKKTLDDHAEYSQCASEELFDERRRLFQTSAKLLRQGKFQTEAEYQALLMSQTALPAAGLYADLPENQRLLKVRIATAKELLERYNMASVQGMLLYAKRLELLFNNVTIAQLRRLMRHIRFFRLVATLSCDRKSLAEGDSFSVKMAVDGPGSVFVNARSYGLQLAQFFPHVCEMAQWQLKAKVKLRERWRNLHLDESCRLAYHGQQQGAYIPEEVALFKQAIEKKLEGTQWHLAEECPCIKCKGGKLIFPDFAFMDDAGRYFYLELFHRWHATQLTERLVSQDKGTEYTLLLGVDNAIASQPEIAAALQESAYFQQYGFIYRDYPLPDKVVKLLQQCSILRS